MNVVVTAEQVAEVYRELLKNEDVRVDDDWFDVGGTSITGLTLVARLNQVTGIRLRLRDVVRSPTPLGLAAVIEDLAVAAGRSGT
jgi:aryl carrier-like protein